MLFKFLINERISLFLFSATIFFFLKKLSYLIYRIYHILYLADYFFMVSFNLFLYPLFLESEISPK